MLSAGSDDSKSGAQLDQIRATGESSVRIQLSAKLLHSQIFDILIHKYNLERTQNGMLLADRWNRLAVLIASDGREPDRRNRPGVLDVLLGITAPRGRPRKKKLADCRPSTAPFGRKANCRVQIGFPVPCCFATSRNSFQSIFQKKKKDFSSCSGGSA